MLFCNRILISLLLILFCKQGIAQEIPASSFYTNFTNTHFIDTSGKVFKPAQYIGKVTLFNFVYTKCSNVCPTQTKQLVEIYNSFSKEYQDKIVFVTVSLDSQHDKPKVLKKYAKLMKAEFKQWQFVSSSYDDIKSLQDKLFLFGNPANPNHPKVDITLLKTKQKEEVLKNHMTTLWVVDKNGTLIQRYAASPMDVPRLKTELKQIADL
jgi:protein SCO1/2